MNEPLAGYIGQPDLHGTFGLLQAGAAPTPFQGMLLGAGFPQEVAVWEQGLARQRKSGTRLLNAQGLCAWQPNRSCVWREHGVWEVDSEITAGCRWYDIPCKNGARRAVFPGYEYYAYLHLTNICGVALL
jgi:hypothetical protein